MATCASSPAEQPRRYLVELHRPDAGWAELREAAGRARETAAALRATGTPVRFLRSVYVPEDDVCFLLFEAPSEDTVRDALGRAGLAAGAVATTLAGGEAPDADSRIDPEGG